MAKGKKRKGLNKGDIEVYRHETDKHENAVPVGFASYDIAKPKPKKYEYDPQQATRLEAWGYLALSAGVCFEHKFVMRITG